MCVRSGNSLVWGIGVVYCQQQRQLMCDLLMEEESCKVGRTGQVTNYLSASRHLDETLQAGGAEGDDLHLKYGDVRCQSID